MVAPETAAHAAGTSALLPMLALGIPGSPTAAVLLGGLLIWGLQPGPLLFVEQKDFVWGLIASMYLGNLVGLIVVLSTVPLFASILRIPFSIIAPVIIVICAIGAYTVHNAMLDIWLMLVFGVIGYVFKKLDYPLAPLVLALVLGDKAEDSFRQAMLVSQGEPRHHVGQPAGRLDHHAGAGDAVLAADLQADRADAHAQGRRTGRAASGGLTKENHMPVIALTQGMGSLAQDIAEQLAAELNLSTLQHELAERVAEKMHVSKSLINRLRGGKAGTIERLRADRQAIALYTAEEVLEAAAKGNVVIRGWGATQLLRPVPHIPCIRIMRPFDKRVQWLMKELDTDDRDLAEAEIRRSDHANASRMHDQFGVQWNEPVLFDMVLNTDRLSVETCVQQIKDAAGAARVRRDRGVARAAAGPGAERPRPRGAARPRRDRRRRHHHRLPATASVTLRGIVADDDEKAAAVQVSAGVPGVTAVDDQLRVMSRPTFFPSNRQ